MNHFDMDRNGIVNGIDFLILDELLFPEDYEKEEDHSIFDDDFSSEDNSNDDLW